ncbi:unnamed protein product, partial [Laminaria digitata]
AVLEFSIDPDRTTFSLGEAAATLSYSRVGGYTASYIGSGLGPIDITTDPTVASIDFTPSAAGVGTHLITYQLTNGSTTFTTGVDLSVTSGAISIFNTPPPTALFS